MILNLIFCGQFFILPITTFTFWDSSGEVATEDWGKNITGYLSLLYVWGNQVSHFLLERAHIFPSLPLITGVPTEPFLAFDIPDQF